MKTIVALAKKIGPTDVPVLIAGETGAGKEVVAELIHAFSPRHGQRMVCVNCAEFSEDIMESEFFGSTKGAFTGSNHRVGIVEDAKGSTLFLDELSEMPLHLQSKLLRFTQDKMVRRVGSNTYTHVDVRLLAGINRDPQHCVADKNLREDLCYRLNTVTISVPPLRDRRADILPLAKSYLKFFCKQYERDIPKLSVRAVKVLMSYAWPGNVRQLMNEMSRCAILCHGQVRTRDLSIVEAKPTDAEQAAARILLRNGSLAQSNGHVASPSPAHPAPHSAEQSSGSFSGSFVGLSGEGFLD